MSMDPNRWINTLPFTNKESNQEKYKLDSNRWINTISVPVKDENILILSNTINSKPKSNTGKKYSLIICGFVVGLILVSIIKNETRNLQKEISDLYASINTFKLDLHQSTLEHEFITSPENISRLASEYLESDFDYYKKSQIRQFKENIKTSAKLEEKKDKKNLKVKNKLKTEKIKMKVAKKIERTKTELKKLQELYSHPEKVPGLVRYEVAKKIEAKKNELEELYSDPYGVIKSKKLQKWAGLQIVKVFLGIPIVPGR